MLSTVSAQETQNLIGALQEDMLREPLDEIKGPVKPVLGYIRLVYFDAAQQGGGIRNIPHQTSRVFDSSVYFASWISESWVPITQSYTSTLAALTGLGAMELLEPDYQRVYEIRLTDFMEPGITNNASVICLTPQLGWRHDNLWRIRDRLGLDSRHNRHAEDYGIFILTDPDDIAFVIGSGHSKLMVDEHNARRVLLMQLYGEHGEALVSQYILVHDLPASIRAEAALYLEQRARLLREAAEQSFVFLSQRPFPPPSQAGQPVITAHAG